MEIIDNSENSFANNIFSNDKIFKAMEGNNTNNFFLTSSADKILNNTSRIFPVIKEEPGSLFAFFPIYEDEIKATRLVDSYNILNSLKKPMPSLFHKMTMGEYVVGNAVIPIVEEGKIPNINKMLLSDGFEYEDIYQNLNMIISRKSQKDWKTSSTINSANYLNKVNALLVSRAEKINF